MESLRIMWHGVHDEYIENASLCVSITVLKTTKALPTTWPTGGQVSASPASSRGWAPAACLRPPADAFAFFVQMSGPSGFRSLC